jgi:hypothetical protein
VKSENKDMQATGDAYLVYAYHRRQPEQIDDRRVELAHRLEYYFYFLLQKERKMLEPQEKNSKL